MTTRTLGCSPVQVAVAVDRRHRGRPAASRRPALRHNPVGPYVPENFTAADAGLCKWIEENGYHIAGAPFDKYVRGGEDADPQEYVTEIYFPIAK